MSFLMNVCVFFNVLERFGVFYIVSHECVCFERFGTFWNVFECIRLFWKVLERCRVYDVIVDECACVDTCSCDLFIQMFLCLQRCSAHVSTLCSH